MFCARYGIKAGSYTAPQPHLRARPKVSALDDARDETASDMCESSATSKGRETIVANESRWLSIVKFSKAPLAQAVASDETPASPILL